MVVVRNKNGGIHLCVDFWDLNQISVKDNYPFPNMESFLQQVIISELMSMLDGFLGYNQVLMDKECKYKTTFTTPWGMYAYKKMPFGLNNVGATF